MKKSKQKNKQKKMANSRKGNQKCFLIEFQN